ncbi:sugar ABC transporter ATP-binding protein [Paenarthrobacter sp. NPDC058040]|uniref:sugar ABC transporter ATP-binding protein n=1 Tax=unclassified Paenarthrobacter TaxID=2634190 RepID=UPI0036DDBC08
MEEVDKEPAAVDAVAANRLPDNSALLSVRELRKEFAGMVALDDVTLDLHGGEILAVLGHNGSGKSTLVKVLAGVYKADGGHVRVGDGNSDTEMHFIHQDLGLIPELTAVENLSLVRDKGLQALGHTSQASDAAKTREKLARFGAEFDVTVPISKLTAAQRSIIAIARALDGWHHDQNILVLDEPTEALHSSEVQILFKAVRAIAARGAGVIFISHRLDEVLDLADRIVVLRDGMKVADTQRADMNQSDLVRLISGVHAQYAGGPRTQEYSGTPAMQVSGLTGQVVRGIDLSIHPGEIVGVAGVLGSGREEIPSLLFGAHPGTAREYRLAGNARTLSGPKESIKAGLAYIPGDRARLGAVLELSARENLTLPKLAPFKRLLGRLDRKAERAEVASLMTQFGVRPSSPEQKMASFSGGNQQKIVLSKWLRNQPEVLLLEEPTQGVDIGAKGSIYAAITAAAEAGMAVLVCSSDAKELVQLCSRVYVLRDGKTARVLTGVDVNETQLIQEGYGITNGTEVDGPEEKTND